MSKLGLAPSTTPLSAQLKSLISLLTQSTCSTEAIQVRAWDRCLLRASLYLSLSLSLSLTLSLSFADMDSCLCTVAHRDVLYIYYRSPILQEGRTMVVEAMRALPASTSLIYSLLFESIEKLGLSLFPQIQELVQQLDEVSVCSLISSRKVLANGLVERSWY